MQDKTMQFYIEEARKQRSEYTAELFSKLVGYVKKILQLELPNVVPGPLAHR